MSKDRWLPTGFELPDRSKVGSCLYSAESWQQFEIQGGGFVLIALPQLAEKWSMIGLLDESSLGNITFGSSCFRCLVSQKRYTLAPIEECTSPDNKVDALAFAVALNTSRKVSPDASFHDAIYVEQLSRLLPTWTLTPRVDDELVLGRWLTGGVLIPTTSFRRLCSLMGWLSPNDLLDIVKSAGLKIPTGSELGAGGSPLFLSRSNEGIVDEVVPVKWEQPQTLEAGSGTRVFSLPGRPKLEEFFCDYVIDIIFNPLKYQALGIDFPSAIVLHGPSGCGKTFAVERLVEFIDWPSYSIDSNSVGSPYIHETSKKIAEVFDKAIDNAPSVIVIDEMESFLSNRLAGGSSSLHHVEEVAEFLRRIPEAIKKKVLVIGMTNMIEMIDPAILRRGRFDQICEVGMPSKQETASLLETLLNKIPRSENINLDTVIDALTGKPCSDLAFVVREAARIAAKSGKAQIDQDSMTVALESLASDSDNEAKRIGFSRDT